MIWLLVQDLDLILALLATESGDPRVDVLLVDHDDLRHHEDGHHIVDWDDDGGEDSEGTDWNLL